MKTFFMILVCSLMIVSGCKKEVPKFEVGQTAKIPYKKSVQFNTPGGPITIAYSDMIEDSRCPDRENVACIWAGRAEIAVSINNEAPLLIALGDLHTGANPPLTNTLTIGAYTLELVDVENGLDHGTSEKKKSRIVVRLY